MNSGWEESSTLLGPIWREVGSSFVGVNGTRIGTGLGGTYVHMGRRELSLMAATLMAEQI